MKRLLLRIRSVLWPRRFGVQLAIIFSLSLTLSMTLFTYYSSEREANRNASSMRLQASVLAENLAATMGGHLLSRDYASIENTLLRAARTPGVREIQLVDTHGKRLGDVIEQPGRKPQSLYGRPALSVPIEEKQNFSLVDENLIIWQPIMLGEVLGWVRVVYGLQEVYATQRAVWMQNGLSALVLIAVVIMLLHVFLRRPLHTLARYTHFSDNLDAHLGEHTNVYRANTELEKLGSALNRVSRRLADQDTAIQEALIKLHRLAAFPENDPNIVISLDASGARHYLNPAAKRFLESGPQQVDQIQAFMPPDIAAIATECIASKASRHGVETQHHGHTFLWTLAPVSEENLLHCYAVDITELKRAEEQASAALIDKLSAEAASNAKSQFLAIMSHEIRTPMNGVLGMTELLLGTKLDARQQRFVEVARGSAQSLLAIINDILDFSKIEAGKLELEIAELDLRALLDELGSLFAEQAYRKKLELYCIIPPTAQTLFRGDYHRLSQIFTNLISNAIKFTPQGDIFIKMLPAQSNNGTTLVRFEVHDTGIGIPPNVQDKIFDSFAQADGSTTRHYGGTGLGLAICKQLAQLMGGNIGVQSEIGKGSTFWFTVALAPSTQHVPLLRLPQHEARALKVLIADDHPESRRALQQQLEAWQIANVSAHNEEEVIAQLRSATAQEHAFTTTIIDYHHDSERTVQLARRIGQDRALTDIALILPVSAQHPIDLASHELTRNSVTLDKPIRQSSLFNCLRPSIRQRHEITSISQTTDSTLSPAPSRLESAHVLVAEDNPVNQELARYALEGLGCKVQIVANGAAAVAAFRNRGIDVILMDCQMPELDGYGATAQIRALEKKRGWPTTPIIALTANVGDDDRVHCLAADMSDYLSKPFTVAELGEILLKWLPPSAAKLDPPPPNPNLICKQ